MIYVDPHVEAVQTLLRPTLKALSEVTPIVDRLSAIADAIQVGHAEQHLGVWVLIRNHHPELAGLSNDELWAVDFTEAQARTVAARDHGFVDWAAVENFDGHIDPDFEAAVDAVVSGDREALMVCFGLRPDLVGARSSFGHGATLLHYVAANGVEIHRQTVPQNAIQIAELLLTSGADPKALFKAYGGEYGPLAMLLTSGHPQMAGVAKGLEVLLRAVDGL